MTHHTPESGENEHQRPRAFDNELSTEEIKSKADSIRELHGSGVRATEIYKTLESPGKRLGRSGKELVSGL